jgi:hypothetical protein
MVVITWTHAIGNDSDHQQILLTKDDGSQLTLSIGDLISFDGYEEYGVAVRGFTGESPEGPIGMIYLPRRKDRWATKQFTWKGDPRHAICHPVGLPHYGVHPNWNSVTIMGPCPDDDWK